MRRDGEAGMREAIIQYNDDPDSTDEHMLICWKELVRCKDCKHRGKTEKCLLAAISEEKECPLFILDNRGDWFCADGERRTDNA